MTISYSNSKGMIFIINIKFRSEIQFTVEVEVFSTKSPALVKHKFSIPYGHNGIIPPFNFNALEEGIKNLLRIMYRDSTIEEFKSEDMVEIIDMMIQQEAPVIDIQVNDEYHVYKNVTV
ncbi:beta C1 protein [Tomato leaf curl Java betasatellite]|uniref:Beta C1 protein n=1 Tax=Tomato leaf curl Java betasatellite TaxID=53991 RepID=M1KJU3_9VIRU|nr:beta C1 protein [Tomato leaf curl Java betasatellite]AGF37248.1 beta C1 protein [Tomato leaf curl Java betasatellite]QXU63204.1 Beta C1 [Tomato leaf curl Java betasatellite]QXU63205.1 Beta C1 [Tomato leaf curl Java betasatellite]